MGFRKGKSKRISSNIGHRMWRGKTIQLLSKRNTSGKIVGIDYSEQAVKDSIRANKQDVEKGKVNILQASVTDMPFSNNTFDIITAFQTHYFWPDLEKGVKEAFRVLKKMVTS